MSESLCSLNKNFLEIKISSKNADVRAIPVKSQLKLRSGHAYRGPGTHFLDCGGELQHVIEPEAKLRSGASDADIIFGYSFSIWL